MARENETPKENIPNTPQEKQSPAEKVDAPSGDFFFGGSKKTAPPVEEEEIQDVPTGGDIFIGGSKARKKRPRKKTSEAVEVVPTEESPQKTEVPIDPVEQPIQPSGGDIFIGGSKARKKRPRKTTTEAVEVVPTEENPQETEVPIDPVEQPILPSNDITEIALGDKLFPMAQTLLYIFLGLACIGPIRAMMGGKPATEQLPILLLFPFLILLHRKLIDKIESEFANGRDYLMGGIVILFASLIVLTVSVVAPMLLLMRPLGVISAICHMIYAVNVLQRIK